MSSHCHHCGGLDSEYKFHIQQYSLYQCPFCQLAFLDPQPTDEQLTKIDHAPSFTGSLSAETGEYVNGMKKETAQVYLDELVSYTKHSNLRLLEIGRGQEDFICLAQEKGFDVTRIEASEHAARSVNKKLGGGYTISGTLETIAPDRLGTFDVCVLFDGVEQGSDLTGLMTQIRQILKEDGILLIVTPSLDSWSARRLKSQWLEFKPAHLFYFNTQNLETFLIKSGFQNITTSPHYKILNFDAIQKHLEKLHVRFLISLSNVLPRAIPAFLKQQQFRMMASGISTICQKTDLPRMPQKLSIVMPVYNEKQTFSETVEQVLKKQLPSIEKELIIVESNSTDGTQEDVAKYEDHPGVTVIYEERPQGKGHAVRTGLKQVTGDIILIQDADLEYDINDYDALLEPLLKYQKMFVLGSRHGGDWKMRNFENNRLLSFMLNSAHILFAWMINITCGAQLKDPFTMYKVFRKECLYGLEFESNRFDFDWEIVIKFLRKKYFPLEIPVNYSSRSYGEGKKVNLVKDPILWMKALVKFRFGKLRKS